VSDGEHSGKAKQSHDSMRREKGRMVREEKKQKTALPS